jgi:hypothetical protein
MSTMPVIIKALNATVNKPGCKPGIYWHLRISGLAPGRALASMINGVKRLELNRALRKPQAPAVK